jgi:hypothetical protein
VKILQHYDRGLYDKLKILINYTTAEHNDLLFVTTFFFYLKLQKE